MIPLQHGIFMAPYHDTNESPTVALRRDIELVGHLDRLGFSEAWFGEHHSTGWDTAKHGLANITPPAGRSSVHLNS